MNNNNLIHYKYVLLGNSNTGKTSICIRYVNKKFEQIFQSTIGCSFLGKIVEQNDKKYSLDIWDTAGQERYRALLPMYYRNADVAFICVEALREDFNEEISYWKKELDKYCDKPNRKTYIVITKIDLVSDEELEKYKLNISAYFPNYKIFQTSSKKDIGINDMFNYSLKKCIEISSLKKNTLTNTELVNIDTVNNDGEWSLMGLCNIL